MAKIKKGIGASSGVAIAKIFLINEEEIKISKKGNSYEKEVKRLNEGIAKTKDQLNEVKKTALKNLGQEVADIFDAHILVVDDPSLNMETLEMMKSDSVSAEYALNEVANKFIDLFKSMDDEYMKERAADIEDVTQRIIKNILDIEIVNLLSINEEVIIAAEDLTPSQTSQLNKKFVKGFITNIGGRTSHSAIMSRALEIPAVLGLGDITKSVKTNDLVIIDGDAGDVVISPSKAEIAKYEKAMIDNENKKKELLKLIDKPAITKDGHEFILRGNIGNPEEAELVKKYGGDGVGLFRSEFLYMESAQWPTEDVQFEKYKQALETLKGQHVIIRTLDIGGDKKLNYFTFPEEMNPFLGYRAVRLCLDQPEIFKTQIRALLRASKFGILEVNVPMIATIEEFKAVKEIVIECQKELTKEKVEWKEFKLGIMVEIPSSCEIADIFGKYVDFFSIGTNDLIQYTFAADRMSEKVSYLYQPYHPAILRKIKKVIDASNDNKIYTAICGEVAGDIYSTPLLVGMGLHEFSMSPTSILQVKNLIRKLNKKDCEVLTQKALMMESNDEVLTAVKKFLKEQKIEI